MLPGVHWLSIVFSQCEVIQTKQSTLEMQITVFSLDYFAKGIYQLIGTIDCCHLLRIQRVCMLNTEF